MNEKRNVRSMRKHAAIMFTDIVGYTALMGSDEDLAFEVLNKNRALHKIQIQRFGGTLVKEIGDGMLVSFPLASDAVRCAQWIQMESKKQDISLRIGIHQGELIFEKSDVLGDGVNVASRLQEISEPGCITISGPVYRDVKNKAGIHVRFLREENLKNVADPIKVYDVKIDIEDESSEGDTNEKPKLKGQPLIARDKLVTYLTIVGLIVAIALILIWKYEPFNNDSVIGNIEIEKSVAVLPFKNDSPDEENEYFCNGMMEAILNHLVKIEDLQVLSRTDVEIYRNTTKSREEIAKELGVVNILEGSVYKVGNRFRLSVQLINAANGFHLWSDAIEGEYTEEIFAIQSRIAEQVANAMHAVISPKEKEKINAIPTSDITAYDYWLRGQQMLKNYWRTMDSEYIKSALDLYNKALEVDPGFSAAIYLKSRIYFAQAKYDSTFLLAERTLELDPENSDAYYMIGECYRSQGDMKSAIKYLMRSFELDQDRSWTNLALGSACMTQRNGAAKGVMYLQKAMDLAQRGYTPELLLNIGTSFVHIGDFERAEKYISRALDLQVGCLGIQFYSMTLITQGKTEEIISYLNSLREINSCQGIYPLILFYSNFYAKNFEQAEVSYTSFLNEGGIPNSRDSIFLACLYAFLGKENKSLAIYNGIIESHHDDNLKYRGEYINVGFIIYYLAKSDKKMAMKHLHILDEQGFRMGTNYLIENSPLFDSLREDPDCKEIILRAYEEKAKERAIVQEMSDRGEITL